LRNKERKENGQKVGFPADNITSMKCPLMSELYPLIQTTITKTAHVVSKILTQSARKLKVIASFIKQK